MAEVDEGLSLADLADLDVSDIEEVRFTSIPAGVFGWEVTEADLKDDEKDGQRRFKAEVVQKIIEVKSVLDPNVNKDDLIGKTHTERFFVDPSKEQDEVLKSIGRIRAFVSDVGMDSSGKLGDIVRNLKGHVYTCKVVKQKDKEDKTREYTRLQLEPAKK